MPFIDRSYFFGSLQLSSFNEQVVRTAVDNAIANYEAEYLQKVLGNSLYDAFMAGLEAGGFSSQFSSQFSQYNSTDQRWLWLRDGHSYVVNDRTYKWIGFKNTRLLSPIASYVYYNYRRDNVTHTNQVGENSAKAENSTILSPDRKMSFAWSQMVDWNRDLFHMLANLYDESGNIVYPEPNIQELDREVYTKIPFGI